MGPDLDLKGKSMNAVDVTPSKDGIKEPENMTCANNCQDDSFLMEALPNEHTPDQSEDAEINITDSTNSNGKGHFESETQDVTEDSSSFVDTDLGVRNGAMSNDVEVESELRDDGTSSLAYDGFGDLFQTRRKKLTAHWRKFIHPLMWRCKWVELQIRELQAQALKYGRELAECDQRKHHDLLSTSEDLGVKSTPFSFQNRKVDVIKRKKRKRVEESTDVVSYMSQHNLFSFSVNKKSYADRLYLDDDVGNLVKSAKTNFTSDEFGVNGVWPCLEFKDDATLEEILHKIDEAKFQLQTLKVRMDRVISENADKIHLNIAVSSPCNAQTSSAPNALPRTNGEGPAGSLSNACQHTSHIREDVGMPESAVSSYGDVIPLPDSIEVTDQPQIGPSCQKVEDDGLICSNQTIKEEDGVQSVGKPQLTSALQERNPAHPALDAEPVSQSKKAAPPAQQGVKMRKNKRKPARRRARPKYSRRSSG